MKYIYLTLCLFFLTSVVKSNLQSNYLKKPRLYGAEKKLKLIYGNNWKGRSGHEFAINCDFCHTSIDLPAEIDAESVKELCFTCHDNFPKTFPTYGRKGGHPVSGHPIFIENSIIRFNNIYPARLDHNKDFTCASCHDPHNLSKRPHMMKYEYNLRKGTCSGCHDKIY